MAIVIQSFHRVM